MIIVKAISQQHSNTKIMASRTDAATATMLLLLLSLYNSTCYSVRAVTLSITHITANCHSVITIAVFFFFTTTTHRQTAVL